MGCCNEPATALPISAPDPTQHVNYAKGMVLGVDDFTQEHAYLAGRDQLMAREAIGYGTLSGLRVLAEDAGSEGPRLRVTAGSVLVPSGKVVCVPADQCAVLNKWLAKRENAAVVTQLLNASSPPIDLSPPFVFSPPIVVSPPIATSGEISLYLTVCSASCTTRPVPIPGDPCRSEDQLMADSRVADDFRLKLRAAPPVQVEEDALRDFVRWLATNVQLVDAGASPPAADDASWVEALRAAAEPWLDAASASPPTSPPASYATLGDYLFESSPQLTVARDRLCDFLRVAFRFWVTELRPMWMARRCHRVAYKDEECVLLARVVFEVVWVGGSPVGTWQVAGGAAGVSIDESARPFLVHQRLLQEWMLCGFAGEGGVGSGGSVGRVPIRTTQADLTLGAGDYCVLCRQPATRVTLPSATEAGRVYVIKNIDIESPSLILAAATGETIDGVAQRTFTKGHSRTVVSGGAGEWHLIARVP